MTDPNGLSDSPVPADQAGDSERSPLGRRWVPAIVWCCLGIAVGVSLIVPANRPVRPPRVAATAFASTGVGSSEPIFRDAFMPAIPGAPSVHASTITRGAGDDLLAAWFVGTREGAKDVAIYLARWDAASETWGEPQKVIDRSSASRELGRYVKKLGNPVLHRDPRGRVWMYFVTVSLGGWSGGSVSVKWSDDDGGHWSDAQRLITSPFLNFSSLVRNPPIDLADGGVLLPIYHEFLQLFGELARLDADGRLVARYRISGGVDTLQPAIHAESASALRAFHRRGGSAEPFVYANRSDDAGVTWTEAEPIELPNPSASVAVVPRHDPADGALLALNPSGDKRRILALATADGPDGWRIVHAFEPLPDGSESSYPTLIRGVAGEYHLTYTYGRGQIRHVRFNEAWLEAQK